MATVTVQNNDAILESLATAIFEHHGAEIGDGAIKKNFAMAWLDRKGKKVVAGGLDFAEPVLIGENTNFGFRSHYSQIDADIQDPTREFKFEPMTYDGTVVLNLKHKLQNSGRAQIKNWMKILRMQADTTIKNDINAALWKATPAANEPESIQSIVNTTNTTGTIGGINRAGNTFAQNTHNSTTISDIGSEAGLSEIHKTRITLGGDAKTLPDFGITTATLYAGLFGYLDDKRRLRADEQMTKLGFDQLYIGSTLIGFDGDGGTGECPSSRLYLLNSNHLFMKILQGANFVFEPFSRKDNSLNSTSIFYLMYNLTTNLPSAHAVFSDVSTS